MRRASIAIGVLLASIAIIRAEQFPPIEADNLTGKKVRFPEVAKGHPAVVVLGFTRASQAQTKIWSQHLQGEFATYSAAVLEDVPRLIRGMVAGSIKSGVPEAQRDRFLVVFHGEKELKNAARYDRPDEAYVVLLDSNGSILWRFHGAFTEKSLVELKRHAVAF